MKIGLVLDDSLDPPDGVQQYVLALGGWLTGRGHDVHYLVGQTKRTDVPGVHSLSKTVRVKFNANVVGTPLPARKTAVKALLQQLDLDVLHVQMPYSPVLAGRIIKAAPQTTAVIGTLHIFPNSRFEQAMNNLLTGINAQTLKRFDEIVAVSKVAAEASRLSRNRNIDIVPNPVELARFVAPPRSSNQVQTITFLGRLVPRKGCQLLIEALALLQAQGQLPAGLKVAIGGGGALRPKLELIAAKHGLDKIVKFHGFIAEADKPAFLQAADVAVFPSSGGESFGIVLLEAMAAGALTLAGNNPGYAGVMGADSPLLFDTKSPVALVGLLTRVLSDDQFRRQQLAAQAVLVAKFDIANVGAVMEAKYLRALRSRRAVA